MKSQSFLVSVLLSFLLLCVGTASAEPYETLGDIAIGIMRQLRIDTTGSAALSKAEALFYAQEGVQEVGSDFGEPFTLACSTTAGAMGVFVDSGLLAVTSVAMDSTVMEYTIPVRPLKAYATLDALLDAAVHGLGITDDINATGYWRQPGSDSIMVGPASSNVDTVLVVGFWRCAFLADSADTTDIEAPARRLAVLWGCHLASEMLGNGRADEFEQRYLRALKRAWEARGVEMPVEVKP